MKIIPLNLEKYINASPMIIFIWNTVPNAPVHYVSKNIKIFGYTQDDFMDGRIVWADVIHPKDLQRVRSKSKKYINNGVNKFTQNYRIITKSGEILRVEDKTWVVFTKKGEFLHYCGLIFDNTEKIKLKQELETRQRIDFLANLSKGILHDFNNILTIIIGNISLLSMNDANLNNVQKESIIDLKKASDRARDSINKINNFSSQKSKQKEMVDIFTIIQSIISFLESSSPKIIKKNNMIQPNKYFLYADSNELDQIFLNLCINSIQAIENKKNGPTTSDFIKISANTSNSEYLTIKISDSGVGIPKENYDKIFNPFFSTKKDEILKRNQGLGLSMVYHIIVNKYNGKITFESKLGVGTTFFINLPILKEKEKEEENNNNYL